MLLRSAVIEFFPHKETVLLGFATVATVNFVDTRLAMPSTALLLFSPPYSQKQAKTFSPNIWKRATNKFVSSVSKLCVCWPHSLSSREMDVSVILRTTPVLSVGHPATQSMLPTGITYTVTYHSRMIHRTRHVFTYNHTPKTTPEGVTGARVPVT